MPPIVLDGTTGITTPGLTNTGTETIVNLTTTGNTILGDASTDTLNVGNGGLVKDASGNVGIGTASPATKLHVKGASNYDGVITADNSSTTGGGVFSIRQNGTVCGYYTTNGFAQGNTGSDIAIYAETGKAVTFFSGGSATERMRIDSSGNVGIGTSSPAVKLDVAATTAVVQMDSSSGTAGAAVNRYKASNRTWVTGVNATDNTGAYTVYDVTASAERMRIDSSGNLLVGTTTYNGSSNTPGVGVNPVGQIAIERDAGATAVLNRYTSNGNIVIFRRSGTTVGTIDVTTTATSYVTSSDYRLKENVAPMTGALAKVSLLKPCIYKWKVDGSDGQGFIAHELAEVCPQAVVGEKDATEIQQYEISPAIPATHDEDGNELTPAVEAVMGEREVPKYQGIDTSFLVATLTAAIQELKALVDTQASTITSLTDRITALEAK